MESAGSSLGVGWESAGSPLGVCWESAGSLLGVRWKSEFIKLSLQKALHELSIIHTMLSSSRIKNMKKKLKEKKSKKILKKNLKKNFFWKNEIFFFDIFL